jgi:hypothetical protein
LASITITNFNGTNNAQWAIEIALLLEHKKVYGDITRYDDMLEEPATHLTAANKVAFKDRMIHHGVARSSLLQVMEPRIPNRIYGRRRCEDGLGNASIGLQVEAEAQHHGD